MTDRDVERTIELARRAAPAQTAGRNQQWRWAVLSRLDRKRRPSPALVLLAAGGLAAIVAVGWRQLGAPTVADGSERTAPASVTPLPEPGVERLDDGSRIFREGPSTVLRKRLETSDDVRYELESGTARFEVAPQRSRTFHVQAGPVTVKVVGTRFQLQRLDAVSRVSVTEGHVLVSWHGGSRDLRASEQGTFPPEPASPSPPASVPKKASTTRPAATEAGPAALFERADRARREGTPALAVTPLRTIVDRYPDDPRATAAAFTLGRLSLDGLNQPRQAAVWFEKARLLAKGMPLAEDALAREVEAWNAAGDGALARRRAELYRRTYPNGARLKTVLRLGGLDPAP
jgi:hypothetical protein